MVSDFIFPSSSRITLLARLTTRWSWVEKMNVTPSFRFSYSITSSSVSADLLSRLAVGSSASMNPGLEAKALATATLCCCPPESFEGRLLYRLANPTALRSSMAVFRRSTAGMPCSCMMSSTFSAAVRTGIRLYDWNTKPMLLSLKSMSFDPSAH